MKYVVLGLAAASVLTAAPAAAQSWQVIARSDARVYLIDTADIAPIEDTASARVASILRSAPAGDYSYSVETYQVQCGPGRWRTAGMVEFGPDGAEAGAFPEADAEWEPLRPRTQPEQIKLVACDNHRAQGQAYESIKAYIDAGRP